MQDWRDNGPTPNGCDECEFIRGRKVVSWCWPGQCKAGLDSTNPVELAKCTDIYQQGTEYYKTLVSAEELEAIGITLGGITFDIIINLLPKIPLIG